MVGVALARVGASGLLLTDGNADTVANCRRNLALNGVDMEADSSHGQIQVSYSMALNYLHVHLAFRVRLRCRSAATGAHANAPLSLR